MSVDAAIYVATWSLFIVLGCLVMVAMGGPFRVLGLKILDWTAAFIIAVVAVLFWATITVMDFVKKVGNHGK